MLAVAMAAAACSGETTSTTTAETTTTITTATTVATGRVTLTPNGAPFILEGTRGPYVAALQHYLVCTGHAQPSPGGGSVTADGVFGPITADAVAYYQAELRLIPTGDPDEATFASLARDCNDERTITFEEGANTTEIAGSVAPGDNENLVLAGTNGEVLTILTADGVVDLTVTGADGTVVDDATPGETWEAELPVDQNYSITVSAASNVSYRLTLSTRSPNVVASEFGPMKLEPDGIAIADFGADPDNTIAVVSLVLGSDLGFTDTGWQDGIPGCTGSNRHVTWTIQLDADGQNHPAVLTLDFSDLGGTPFFAQYAYRSFDVPALDPIAQGLTTPEGVSLGTTLDVFTDAYGTVQFFDTVRGLTEFEDTMLAGFTTGDDPTTRLAWYIGAGADGCADFQ
jgi:peptidoglycan hydrolase-like protein with peptidoglycan-binding domain